MSKGSQESRFRRNTFYRANYYRVLRLLMLMALVAVGLAVYSFYLDYHRSQPKYYATTANGRIIPMQSLSEPMVTTPYIVQWAGLAVRSAYNIDFLHYEKQLKKTGKYFTTDGWKAFLGAMTKSGVLKSLKENKLVSSAVVTGAVIITNREVIDGRFTWQIQVPLLVTYTSASMNRKQDLIVTITVKRVPTLQTSQGIQISDFSEAIPAKKSSNV